MKIKIMLFTGCGLFLATLFITGCKKEINDRVAVERPYPTDIGIVQVYNGMVGSNRNHIYLGESRITGTAVEYGGLFPSAAYGFSLLSGTYNFRIRDTVPGTTQLPLAFMQTVQAGSNYTIFLYDTTTSPKQKSVLTNIQQPGDTTARVRFANFIYSKTPVPAVDIFSVKRKGNLFANVQTTEVSDFVPFASFLNDTLLVMRTGTSDTLARINNYALIPKRSYTLVFRGRYQSTTGTAARTLSSFLNY